MTPLSPADTTTISRPGRAYKVNPSHIVGGDEEEAPAPFESSARKSVVITDDNSPVSLDKVILGPVPGSQTRRLKFKPMDGPALDEL